MLGTIEISGTRITEYGGEFGPALSVQEILSASDTIPSPGQLQRQRWLRVTQHKRIYHPTLGLMEELPTLSTDMTRGARIEALTNMASIYQFSSVTDSTKHEYLTGWRHYTQSFCEREMECCPYFTRQYTEYRQQGPIPYPTQLIILFYVWLREAKKVQPGTAASYISAVRFMLKNSGIDDKCFDHTMLGVTKTGSELLFRGDHPEVESKKLPITCGMILEGKKSFSNSIEDQMEQLATEMAYTGLLRFSEYADTRKPGNQHFIRADDVQFTVISKVTGQITKVSGSKAHTTSPEETVHSVTFTVPSAKNDKFGTGHRFTYETLQPGDTVSAFDLAQDMFNFAKRAKPRSADPFLSIDGRKQIKYDKFSATLKRMVAVQGFDPEKFSTHSLRIGGATALAAAGIPDSTIQTLGRWKSLAFLAYIRTSIATLQRALLSMINPGTVTSRDIEELNPAGSKPASHP